MDATVTDRLTTEVSPSKYNVVVIGAGMAGVTAAAKLYHNGVTDLVVLEAQDYTGGRIKAETVDGKNLDMGAQYIHGQLGNPLFTIASSLGIVIDEEDLVSPRDDIPNLALASQYHLTSTGERVPDKAVTSFLQFLEGTYSSTDPLKLNEDLSVGDIYRKAYDHYLEEHVDEMTPRLKELLDAAYRALCIQVNIDNACGDPNELSGWASLMYEELKGSRYVVAEGGMTSVLNPIVRLLPRELIRTNSPATSVEWNNGDGCEHKSIVSCEDGKQYEADYVIVTISTACLKKGLSMFQPPLPSPFVTALSRLELGVTAKVYLQWESAFWEREDFNSDSMTVSFLWLESSPVTINSDRTQKLTRDDLPWWNGTCGFDVLSEDKNMLEFWFSSPQEEILVQLPDEDVMCAIHEMLKVFFKDDTIPEPIAMYKSGWRNNPYVGGSYTYATRSFQRSDMDILSRPIPSIEDPRLSFAGEAFSLEAIGTAHGAYKTGEQKADIVLQAMGVDTSHCLSVVELVKKNNK